MIIMLNHVPNDCLGRHILVVTDKLFVEHPVELFAFVISHFQILIMFISCAGSFVIDNWWLVVLLLSSLGLSTSPSFLDAGLVLLPQEKLGYILLSLLEQVDMQTLICLSQPQNQEWAQEEY